MVSPRKPIRAFISYKWEGENHQKWVEKFASDLRGAGIESILDKWHVRYGDSFVDYMTSMIGEADIVLFIMTKKAVEAVENVTGGGAVKFELQLAKTRSIAGERMRLIGILREGKAVPAHLKDRRYADFRDDLKYDACFRELIQDILGSTSIPEVIPGGQSHKTGNSAVFLPSGEIARLGDNVYDHFRECLGKIIRIDSTEIILEVPNSSRTKRIKRNDRLFKVLTKSM